MKKYVIVSLKHSKPDNVVFWQADNNGYTNNPLLAGFYDEETVRNNLDYYADCLNVPVPVTDLQRAGITITIGQSKVEDYQKEIRKKLKP